jgi:hypothetical protein
MGGGPLLSVPMPVFLLLPRQGRHHELLIQRQYQLDDGVIERLVLLVARHFDHLKQVINEPFVEMGELGAVKLLHAADLVHEVSGGKAEAGFYGR